MGIRPLPAPPQTRSRRAKFPTSLLGHSPPAPLIRLRRLPARERAYRDRRLKGFKHASAMPGSGKLLGFGIGSYLEATAPPNKRWRQSASSRRRRHHHHGTTRLRQGHAAPFAHVLSSLLGVPFERIKLLAGRQRRTARGRRHRRFRPRCIERPGDRRSAALVVEKGKQSPASCLRSAASRHRVQGGQVHHAGTYRFGSASWNWRRSCAPDGKCR